MIDIILIEPENEGNAGAICRVMANFGFKRLVAVNPKCDLSSEDFFRRAKHSKHVIKAMKIRKNIPKYDILIATTSKIFSDYNVSRSPLTPLQLAEKLSKLKNRQRIGIMFGRESSGLTNKEISKADILIAINSSKDYSALNISHAVAIILYELNEKTNEQQEKGRKLLDCIEPAGETEHSQIEKKLSSIINNAGFSTKEKKSTQKKIWKNILNRAILNKREAFGVLGLLSKIQKKVNHAKN